jgi:hypothetical protein
MNKLFTIAIIAIGTFASAVLPAFAGLAGW